MIIQAEHVALKAKYRRIQSQYDKVRFEIRALNIRIEDITTRIERAIEDGKKSFQFSLGIQMSTVEGVREMYATYGTKKILEYVECIKQLLAVGIIHDEYEDLLDER